MRKKYWMAVAALMGIVVLAVIFVSVNGRHRLAPMEVDSVREDVASEEGTGEIHKLEERSGYLCQPDSQLKERLRRTYQGIAVAFSNREVVVMQQLFSVVRDDVRMLNLKDFNYAKRAIESTYWDAWFVDGGGGRSFRPLDNFPDVGAFALYIESLLTLVKIRAEGSCLRRDYDGIKGVEALPLRLLKEYKKKFSKEQRRDFEACTDRMISDWIAFIESSEGYSHQYARAVFPGNLKIHEHGSREDAVKITRLVASVELETFAGYTPKWLDEIK